MPIERLNPQRYPTLFRFMFRTVRMSPAPLCALLLSVASASTAFCQGQDAPRSDFQFHGIYLAPSVGVQNIFGGAFIQDLDLLTQKSAAVLELDAGYRWQVLDSPWMIGIGAQVGLTDGDLEGFDARNSYDLAYENNRQTGFGITAGYALGAKRSPLLFAYGLVTRRSFDIEISDSSGVIARQEDGQRFLRYGLGVEIPIEESLHVRLCAGGVDVQYDDLSTSQDVEDKLDVNLGIVWRR